MGAIKKSGTENKDVAENRFCAGVRFGRRVSRGNGEPITVRMPYARIRVYYYYYIVLYITRIEYRIRTILIRRQRVMSGLK